MIFLHKNLLKIKKTSESITNDIKLESMTKPLCRAFFQGFINDPDVYKDAELFMPYTYNESRVDAYWERQQHLGRIHLAVVLDAEPVGEIIFKNLDPDKKHCTLSIHLKNDSVKNKAIGIAAEIAALQYAFEKLNVTTVYADALLKNKRSCHVLEKVGFTEIRRDADFCYYKFDACDWL